MATVTKGSDAPVRKRQPMKQKRSKKAENIFVDAAEMMFRKNGYAGTRIQDIIEYSGYSTGSFYNCFNDKMGLYNVVIERYVHEATAIIDAYDMTRETHGTLYNLFVTLILLGRKTVSNHLGCYRAAYELMITKPECFEPLFAIRVQLLAKLKASAVQYQDQMDTDLSGSEINSAIQLISMSGLQTELNMAELFPNDLDEFSHTIARAACGIVRYNLPLP